LNQAARPRSRNKELANSKTRELIQTEFVMKQPFKMATVCALATISFLAWNGTASAQTPQCLGGGSALPFGQNTLTFGANATAYIGLASGTACTLGYGGAGTVQSAKVTTRAAHGTVRMLGNSNLEYRAKPGYKGADTFAVTVKGTGPLGSGTSVISVNVTVN
jgi:hypothetical protein